MIKLPQGLLSIAVFGVLLLSSCSYLPRYALFQTGVTSQGPRPAIEESAVERVNLIGFLDPDGSVTETDPGKKLEKVFLRFEERNPDPTRRKELRDALQERIILASNQSCDEYKKFLRQFEAEGNFALGLLTTALGGAGAIFTSATTARALSGSAGIFSGIRAEFQEDFFQSLAVHVIADGIDARRKTIYEEIRKRQIEAYSSYNGWAAAKDAVAYHGACSTLVGLHEAGASIRQAQDPGLKRLNQVLKEAGLKEEITIGKDGLTIRTRGIDLEDVVNPLMVQKAVKFDIGRLVEKRANPLKENIKKTEDDPQYASVKTKLGTVRKNLEMAVSEATADIDKKDLVDRAKEISNKILDSLTAIRTETEEKKKVKAQIELGFAGAEAKAFQPLIELIRETLRSKIGEAEKEKKELTTPSP